MIDSLKKKTPEEQLTEVINEALGHLYVATGIQFDEDDRRYAALEAEVVLRRALANNTTKKEE